MYEITKIQPLAFARFSAITGALMGLVPMALTVVLSAAIMMFNPYRDSSSVFSLIFGVAVPLIFALIGLIFGFIFAYLYNWLAPHIGGIKMNLVFHQDQE